MKFTFNWLKDHLETTASLEEIVEKLSLIGLEVEGVENKAVELAAFKACRVKEAKQHPNADRLRVCQVESADGNFQVVCGAPNAKTGMIGVFAPVGTHIPGTDLMLKASELRGEASNGMLVSEREMGLSDEHDGIVELPADTPVGKPVAEALGLDDATIEIAITPNRGDCLGVRGIARDLAAAGLGGLRPFKYGSTEGKGDSAIAWAIADDAADDVVYAAGRSFRDVKNGPSPQWLQKRLNAIGLRSVSTLVDITNYVSFDLGRPLHVFDTDKLRSKRLTWRKAREGEEFLALDGSRYSLSSTTAVACDGRGAVGIGGIIGGLESGCSNETSNVFLEVALFDRVSVATSGRKTGIHSDARYRFERRVDPQSARWGMDVATRMILDLCGGEASKVTQVGVIPAQRRSIDLRTNRVKSLCGVSVATDEQVQILEKLGFSVEEKSGDILSVAPPSWRPDVELEACLVEEVLRIHGYDKIPATSLPRGSYLPKGVLTEAQKRRSAVRTALCWQGLDEAVTFSFISAREAALFGGVDDCLRVDNPISKDLDSMRPSILPTLLAAAARNTARGFEDNALFEIGPQYRDDTTGGQRDVATCLRSGKLTPTHWDQKARAADIFDAKGDAFTALEAAGVPVENLQVFTTAPSYYHPGRSGVLGLGPKNLLATFGELHPKILKAMGLKGRAVACEVYLDAIPAPKAKKGQTQSSFTRSALHLAAFQPVKRDFAFIMDEKAPADKLVRAVRGANKALIDNVLLFDIYSGQGVGEGKKSVALTVTLQPREQTLTDEEIEAVSQKIIAQAMKAGGTLRT